MQHVRPDDLGALVVKETLKRAGNYEGTIDDLIIGCAMPEAEQGLNMARNIGALAGLPILFLLLQLIVIVLLDFKPSPMEQKELCSGIPIQLLQVEQNR